jgi:hypothetical protein
MCRIVTGGLRRALMGSREPEGSLLSRDGGLAHETGGLAHDGGLAHETGGLAHETVCLRWAFMGVPQAHGGWGCVRAGRRRSKRGAFKCKQIFPSRSSCNRRSTVGSLLSCASLRLTAGGSR